MRKLAAALLLILLALWCIPAYAQQGWIQRQIISGVLSIPSYRMVLYAQKNAALTRGEQDENWLSGLGVYVQVSAESGLADTVTLVETSGNLQTLRFQANGSHNITFVHSSPSVESEAIELPGGNNYTLLPGEIIEFVVMGPNWIRMVAGGGTGGTPGTGDINSVFGCTSGTCSSIQVLDGQLLSFQQVNPNTTTEGLILPQATACASAVANGQVCWQGGSQLYVGNGTSAVLVTGGSGGGGGTFSKNITDANSFSNALIVGNGTQHVRLWGDTDGSTIQCRNGTIGCNLDLIIPENFRLRFFGRTGTTDTLFEDITHTGVHTYYGNARPLKTIQWGPWGLEGDGAECDLEPTKTVINGVPHYGLQCPMAGTETPGFIHSSPHVINLPYDFDKTAGITFNMSAHKLSGATDGTHHGFMQIDCWGPGEEPGTFSSAVNMDLTPLGAQPVNSKVVDSSATLDTSTAGANCNPGNSFTFRWASCDTDTTPPADCSDSLGFENRHSIYNVTMFYRATTR